MKLKNKSTFLSIIGAFGVVATAVMAAKETPKALKLLEEEEDIKGEQLTVSEKIFVIAPAYWKTAAFGVGTIVCIFGANALNRRQQASLVSACTMATNSFNNYRNEVRERIGEEEERDIYTKIKTEEIQAERNKVVYRPPGYSVMFTNGKEEDQRLFYLDLYQSESGLSHKNRYVECSLAHVMEAILYLNLQYEYDGCQKINDFYELLGIKADPEGDDYGWYLDEYAEITCIEFIFTETTFDDGLTCIILSPVYGTVKIPKRLR